MLGALKSILRSGIIDPRIPVYPFGTVLRHRDTYHGGTYTHMESLKAMVIGYTPYEHPERIRVIRLTGMPSFVGKMDDVYVESWEPVDG